MNTPRTDKAEFPAREAGGLHMVVSSSFARKLERELIRAEEELAKYYVPDEAWLKQKLNDIQNGRINP